MSQFLCVVLSSVDRGLATDRSTVQGFLPGLIVSELPLNLKGPSQSAEYVTFLLQPREVPDLKNSRDVKYHN